ncbi:HAT dimerization [Penicillium soppii]|uniref:HAT dimerization n=1 Tax=Penicillium soppii TaxID=69789 RepID=UPI002547B564|nr:HAT dimerization [Penicillium soppii]KAJ5851258.1 HAT dimerization [Penicillium soppii]
MLRRAKRLKWRQVDYLLYIIEPFYRFTTVLSKTKEITVYHVFGIYNALFEHFKESIARLTPKTIPWKKAMLQALNARMVKLSSYYTKTKEIYVRRGLLTPKDTPRHNPYEESNPPYRHLASISDLDALLDLRPHIHSNLSTSEHELARYLEKLLSARKRQRSELVDSEDESSPHLPLYGDESGTQRRPGLREARKRGKPSDDQFVSY